MQYNATHKQLARTRKIMRLRAYIIPCMYFSAISRSSPSAQKKTHDDNFPHVSSDLKKTGGKYQGEMCGDLQEQPCNFCVLLVADMCPLLLQ